MSPFVLFIHAVIRLYVWKATKRSPGDIKWAVEDLERCRTKVDGTQKEIDYINIQCGLFYNIMLASHTNIFDSQALYSHSREVLLNWILHSFRGTFPFTHQVDDLTDLPPEDDLTLTLAFMDTFNISTSVYRDAIQFWRCEVRELQRKRKIDSLTKPSQ